MAELLNWNRKRVGDAPAINIYPSPNRSGVNTNLLGPSRNSADDAIMRKESGASSVVRLFRFRGPNAVFGFVISIIIFSFNAVFFGWARPHIRDEVLKPPPAFTDLDSSSPIILKRGISGTSTASVQKAPYPIFDSFAQAVGTSHGLRLIFELPSATLKTGGFLGR